MSCVYVFFVYFSAYLLRVIPKVWFKSLRVEENCGMNQVGYSNALRLGHSLDNTPTKLKFVFNPEVGSRRPVLIADS